MGRPPNPFPKKGSGDELVDSSPKAIISIFSKFLQEQADFYRQQSKRFAQIAESLALLDRKRKRKHDIDPFAPKKPDNAYILFVKEQQKKLKEEFPSIGSREIFTKIAGIWGQTTEEEKMQYSHRAEDLKNQYLKEMEDYNTKKSEGLIEGEFRSPEPKAQFQAWTQTLPVTQARPQIPSTQYEEIPHRQSPTQNFQERIIAPSNPGMNTFEQQQQQQQQLRYNPNQEEMMNQYANSRPYYPQDTQYNQSVQHQEPGLSSLQLEQGKNIPSQESEFHDYDDGTDPTAVKKRKTNLDEVGSI